MTLDLNLVGSFQRGHFFRSENPIEEAWGQIARLGTEEFSSAYIRPSTQPEQWSRLRRYGVVRVRQAIEFRRAASLHSLISSPLPLYYSLLNLTRGALASGPEIEPTSKHGLIFDDAASVLDCRARVTSGTGRA